MQDDGLVYDKVSLRKEEGEVSVARRLFKDILSLYQQHAADREGFTMALGERLICPISCGPLISRILAADGYTYEKCSLDRILRDSEF